MKTFAYILFGATGDLVKEKIFPALFQLHQKKLLPDNYAIIATGRTKHTHQTFRYYVASKLKIPETDKFLDHIYYQVGNVKDEKFYSDLELLFKQLESEGFDCGNRMFHLAILPQLYIDTIQILGKNKAANSGCGWTRILIEKPFGSDQENAKKLDETIYRHFEPDQIFRLDHYLAKETVMNILAFRFGNGLFEPIWNNKFIDHIQIQLLEKDDVSQRGIFYTQTGALKDVVQNHLLQLVSVVMMDRPKTFNQTMIRAEREQLLYSIKPYNSKELSSWIISGQYKGFKNEVENASDTETFVALKLEIDKPRWKGVPVYIRTGKALKRKVSEISIVFKKPPFKLFDIQQESQFPPNILTIRLNPNEGIILEFLIKKPGPKITLKQASMRFCYSQQEEQQLEAYAKLIYDAIAGDQTLFTLRQGVHAQWRFVDPILKYWQKNNIKPYLYEKNSWGPKDADNIIQKDDRSWCTPSGDFC
jgi:glucose-6-phosphate 1-dehydrogenase